MEAGYGDIFPQAFGSISKMKLPRNRKQGGTANFSSLCLSIDIQTNTGLFVSSCKKLCQRTFGKNAAHVFNNSAANLKGASQ
ncbi:hypothetical protein BAU14_05270 [Enterococcus sp. CU9D]|nr:hypothetical protein BAU14_05270 [Enterococcus sp. CU9D]